MRGCWSRVVFRWYPSSQISYINPLTSNTFTECPEGEFGQNCASMCQCEADHTVSCNHVNGNCTCNKGWKGNECKVDIDECSETDACNSTLKECYNTQGSFMCKCKTGYSIYDDGVCRGNCMQYFHVIK